MRKLIGDRVSAVTATDVTVRDILKDAGHTIDELEQQYTFMDVGAYFAFSKDVSFEVVDAWRSVFEDIRNDGTLYKIRKKWLPKYQTTAE